jgi:hypothetical protein
MLKQINITFLKKCLVVCDGNEIEPNLKID